MVKLLIFLTGSKYKVNTDLLQLQNSDGYGVVFMIEISMEEAVQLCREGEKLLPEEKKAIVNERLKMLVSYAKKNSAYFRKLYSDIDEDNFSLEDLPPVTKSELMKCYEDWVTDPDITYDGVTEYVNTPIETRGPYLGKYSALMTSGTSGNPMPMVRDSYHNIIHGTLIQTRFLKNVDEHILDPKYNKLATIIFTDPSVSSYSSFLKVKALNPDYSDNMLAISLQEGSESIIKKLNDFQPDLLTAYPSTIGPLISAAEEGRLSIHLKAIGFSAEVLSPETRCRAEAAFNCPVLNNYCSTEGGEAAMACKLGNLHINDDWVIIEPVDKDGNPVKDGEWSEGIYVTDLTNYVQPVIRYYMNDSVKITRTCGCGMNLPIMEINGRVLEEIQVEGKRLSGLVILHSLHEVKDLYTYQVAHVSEGCFELRAEFANGADKEKILNDFSRELNEYLLNNGCREVTVKLSSEPPRHNARGGKIKEFVKEF